MLPSYTTSPHDTCRKCDKTTLHILRSPDPARAPYLSLPQSSSSPAAHHLVTSRSQMCLKLRVLHICQAHAPLEVLSFLYALPSGCSFGLLEGSGRIGSNLSPPTNCCIRPRFILLPGSFECKASQKRSIARKTILSTKF